jgi:hypothetical protein
MATFRLNPDDDEDLVPGSELGQGLGLGLGLAPVGVAGGVFGGEAEAGEGGVGASVVGGGFDLDFDDDE